MENGLRIWAITRLVARYTALLLVAVTVGAQAQSSKSAIPDNARQSSYGSGLGLRARLSRDGGALCRDRRSGQCIFGCARLVVAL